MSDPIQVEIGVAAEAGGHLSFYLLDEGVKFNNELTADDLIVSIAVLRDLADALALRLAHMTN